MSAADPDPQPTDCLICFQPVTANLQCGGCRKVFCQTCLSKWLAAPDATPSCPACRREQSLEFSHSPDIQAAADVATVVCDLSGCNVVFRWADRAAHLALCPMARLPCPFPNCAFVGSSPDVDLHSFTCPAARAVKISERVQKVLDEPYVQTAPLSIDAIKNLLGGAYVATATGARKAPAHVAAGPGTVVHTVLSTDTMEGLAVRYGTSRQELRRLNHITRDTDLMAYPTILVPVTAPAADPAAAVDAVGAGGAASGGGGPAGPGGAEGDEVSLDVVLALKKRNLVKTLMFLAKCDAAEAVSYLHLNEYHLQAAQRHLAEDREWERVNNKRKPKTFAQFSAQIKQRMQNEHACAGCQGAVCDKRRHCTRCGRLYCKVCCAKLGECARTVSKARLGATSPESREQPTAVCNDCFAALLLAA